MKTLTKIGCIGALVAGLLACDSTSTTPLPITMPEKPAVHVSTGAKGAHTSVDDVVMRLRDDYTGKDITIEGEVLGYAYDYKSHTDTSRVALTLKGSARPLLCKADFVDYKGTAVTLVSLVQAELRDGGENRITIRGTYDGSTLQMKSVKIQGYEVKLSD